jgi:hypothetical protein
MKATSSLLWAGAAAWIIALAFVVFTMVNVVKMLHAGAYR